MSGPSCSTGAEEDQNLYHELFYSVSAIAGCHGEVIKMV
jgi:hypothetical protein